MEAHIPPKNNGHTHTHTQPWAVLFLVPEAIWGWARLGWAGLGWELGEGRGDRGRMGREVDCWALPVQSQASLWQEMSRRGRCVTRRAWTGAEATQ